MRPDQLDAVGKALLRRLRREGVPRPDGIAGAPFVVFHGNVDEDNDGPIEWCWPVPDEQAAQIAARFADLRSWTEDAHHEAFIQAETAHAGNARATAAAEALLARTDREHRSVAAAIRQVLAPHPAPAGDRAGCDWAFPLC